MPAAARKRGATLPETGKGKSNADRTAFSIHQLACLPRALKSICASKCIGNARLQIAQTREREA
jgi:hypothetical protein